MRLVLAVSKDGYFARKHEDDMSWLGATDKAVFRILTGVGGVVGVGTGTRCCMPVRLEGRSLITISSEGHDGLCADGEGQPCSLTLEAFSSVYPDGWIAGGPTLAMAAIQANLVDELHLCRSDRMAFPHARGAIKDRITPYLRALPWWSHPNKLVHEMSTKVLDVTVERWVR